MKISTPDLCDYNPEKVRVLQPILKNFGGRKQFWGQIVTLRCFEDNSLVKDLTAQPGNGKVLVVDGGGSMRRALLGDLIAEIALSNGWSGFVINGCIRDVDIIAELDIGVQALGCVPLKTEKLGVGAPDVPVSFGGVDFKPGEYLYADNNGVIVSSEALDLHIVS